MRFDADGSDDDARTEAAPVVLVFCVTCGRTDCPGCRPAPPPRVPPGAIPWECIGPPLGKRFYATAAGATRTADSFFAALPSGSILSALAFAVLAEVLAVGSIALVVLSLAAAVSPDLLLACARSPAVRRGAAVAAGALVVLSIGAHVGYGLALDRAARRAGAPTQRSRAVRAALYTCGWDFFTSPAGLVAAFAMEGVGGAVTLLGATRTAPRLGTLGALRGLYGSVDDDAARAGRNALFATLVGVVIVVAAGLVVLAWAGRD